MLVTPEFTLSQDDQHLTLVIRVPYVKISNSEVYVDANSVTFYLKPYHLKLCFEQQLLGEDKVESAIYDHNTYKITLKIKKKTEKEHFKDLDLISKLLQPKAKKKKKMFRPKIEILNSSTNEDENSSKLIPLIDNNSEYHYGFDHAFEDVFENHLEEIAEIGDLDPSSVKEGDREKILKLIERKKFDPDYYLCDFFEDEMILEKTKQKLAFICKDKNSHSLEEISKMDLKQILSDKEWDSLIRVGNKDYLLDKKSSFNSQLMIIDILFAYIHEYRSMDMEHTCESGWSINKLSTTLSGFVYFETCEDVLVASFRRSLVYPLHRNFKFSQCIKKDIESVLETGKRLVVKILADIKGIFEKSDPRYLLNLLYIDDLLVYAQKLQDNDYKDLLNKLTAVEVSKTIMGFDLEDYEQEAELNKID